MSVAPASSSDVWRTGRLPERRAYLARLREADPDAARDLLADGWAKETGADRGQLISVLERGLSLADEEFLDAALDDRHGTVRAAARRLLGRLPGTAFSQRANARAEGALRVERLRGGHALVATLPGEPDAAGPDVHAGLRQAAVSQGDADWAQALLAAGGPGPGNNYPAAVWPSDQELAALLPPAVRVARAAALLSNLPLTTVNPPGWGAPSTPLLDELTRWPAPWPEPVAEAAAAVLDRAAAMPSLPHAARMLIMAGARCLPATGARDYAALLARLADAHEQTWSGVLRSAAATIRFRRAFLTEIHRA
jgi:hypothetical protein